MPKNPGINFEGDQEEDTDRMISCAKAYENDKRIAGMSLTNEGLNWDGYYKGARDYITSFNRLSANLFAAWLNVRLPFSGIYTPCFWRATKQKLVIMRMDARSGGISSTRILSRSLSSQNLPSRYGRIPWKLLTSWFERGSASLAKSRG